LEDDDEISASPVTPVGIQEFVKQGILSKEGGQFHTWHSRFFKLTKDGSIYYFKMNKSKEPVQPAVGCIKLTPNATSVSACEKNNKKYCFQVFTSKRIYYLCAEDETEMKSWMEAIERTTSSSPNRKSVPKPSPISPQTPPPSSTPPDADDHEEKSSVGSPPVQRPLDISQSPKTDTVLTDSRRLSQTESELDDEFDDVLSSEAKRRSTADEDLNGHTQDGPLFLTQEDEYDIALSAAEIFLKDESDRTPEEQAYVLAMRQYRAQLEEHCKNVGAKPEYSFASGTSIFVVPEQERTPVEKEYISDIANEYSEEVKNQQNDRNAKIPLDVQVEIAEAAAKIFAKNPDARTEEEKEYVFKMEEYLRDVVRAERQYNLKAKHSLLSSALMLAKYPEERDAEDIQYLEDMKLVAK
jgi:flagellar motor switch/type III secretory pathway protein FliN